MSWLGAQKRGTNKRNGVQRKKTIPPRMKQKSPVLETEISSPFFYRAGVNIVHCLPFVRVYISCYNTGIDSTPSLFKLFTLQRCWYRYFRLSSLARCSSRLIEYLAIVIIYPSSIKSKLRCDEIHKSRRGCQYSG